MASTFDLSHVTSETLRRAELHLPGVDQFDGDLLQIKVKVEGQKPITKSIDLRTRSEVDITKLIETSLINGDSIVVVKLKIRHKNEILSRNLIRQLSKMDAISLVISSESRTKESDLRRRIERFSTPSSSRTRNKRRKPTRDCRRMNKCLCQKYDLSIDLSLLGWDDRVVYPAKFNAFYCDGRCPTLIERSYTPTNHAILQNLYRLKLPDIPRSRCVPIKLRPLSMLYYENHELIHKHHDDMIVEECGCRWEIGLV